MKRCVGCRLEKPMVAFYVNRTRSDGRQIYCIDCQKPRDRLRWQRRSSQHNASKQRLRRLSREWMDSLKTGPCVDCGQEFPPCVMQWDHRPGESKKADVSVLAGRWSRERVLAEVTKCDLVCANCHALRTCTRQQNRGLTHGHSEPIVLQVIGL